MALFNREDENPAASPPPPAPPVSSKPSIGGKSTYIAPGVKIKGEIIAETEVVVDGEVEGRLELKENLKIGPQGTVNGDIVARSVQVGGKVFGNVRGLDRFELLQSGRIEGDVVSPRVVIAEGAFFKGNVEMASQQAPAPPPAKAPEGNKPAGPDGQPTASASPGTGVTTGGPK
jgi:cytoskeletal protein CcmA (bactofilin family)